MGVIRGIPELLIVFLIYFGSSKLLMATASQFGYHDYIELNPFIAGVIALGLTFGGYATEVFRGAFLAIHKGQSEAAQALGLGRFRIFFGIILPQALANCPARIGKPDTNSYERYSSGVSDWP